MIVIADARVLPGPEIVVAVWGQRLQLKLATT